MGSNITPKEIELIKSVQAGSKSAFTQLFNNYKPFVDALLYTYIKDRDEAQDITNVVFLKVYEKLSTFTDYQSFGGWLRILTKNVAIDYLRTVKQNKSMSELPDCSGDETLEDVELKYTNKMTYDKIVSLFDTLPESYKKVCLLYYVENLTVQQISERTFLRIILKITRN